VIALEVDKEVALKNILFATDFSRGSNVALPYAVSLARQHGAMLHAAHVMSSEPHLFVAPESWPAFMRAEEDRARAEVVRLAKNVQGVPHSVLARAGDVWSVLARFIEGRDIDLLVVGTHGKSGLPELSMGSTAERLLRQAPCPVLTVGMKACQRSEGVPTFNRILFATNFTPASLSALPYAITVARSHQAQLLLLHVLERSTVDVEPIATSLLNRLKDLVPDEAGLRWCPQIFVELGSPVEEILESAADHCADMIVMGVRRVVGKIGTAHLAGIVQKVAARANCPVLTVHGDAPADWQPRLLHGNRARASESRLNSGAFLNCSATMPAAYCG
jgi:nucleotide-binding universal stress UspA family protein